jgi:DNA repair protein RecO (recombination protein O)
VQWSDEGIVLGARSHGESSVILELMTREHGRHLGVVHGGRSRRMAPVLQAGNSVAATWRARLDEHIGHYAVEPDTLRSARLLASPMALYGVGALALHLRLLPERDPHPGLYAAAIFLLDHLDEASLAPALFIRFELMLLAELGYGLDLSGCAATGQPDDLHYVSPKSGRAVSRVAGAPYHDRLLPLPGFLRGEADLPTRTRRRSRRVSGSPASSSNPTSGLRRAVRAGRAGAICRASGRAQPRTNPDRLWVAPTCVLIRSETRHEQAHRPAG